MDSLYGGRPGAPFVLKASFKTIDEMKQEFGKGPAYTGVWYNEYCIIDTENKDHRDNGKIYQRTPDYSNEMSGARYIGQIVGPQAGSPELSFCSLDNLDKYKSTDLEDGEVRTWVYRDKETGSLSWWTDTSNDSEKEDVYTNSLTVGDGLVSGKERDSIDYAWITTRKADNSIAETKVGLQIPYPEIEFSAELVSPYNNKTVIEDASEKNQDGTRKQPFYSRWKLSIPEGKKGDSVQNIRIGTYKLKEEGESSDSVDGVSVGEIKDPSNDKLYFRDSSDGESATGVIGIAGGRYWLADWCDYDESEAGSKTTYCLGEASKQKLSYAHASEEGSFPEKENLSWFDVSDTNSTSSQVIPVNEVVSLFANVGGGKDNQLYVLYSSAESRANDEKAEGYLKGSRLNGVPDKWKNLNWKALGAVKDESGLLVGHEIDVSSMSGDKTDKGVLEYLNTDYQFTKVSDDTSATPATYQYTCEKDPTLTDGKLAFAILGSTPYFYAWDYSSWVNHKTGQSEGHWKLLGTLSGGSSSAGGADIVDDDNVPNDDSWHLVAKEYQLCDQPSCANWWGTVYSVEDDSSSTLPDTGTSSTLYITDDGIFKWDSATNSYKSLSTTNEYVDAKVQELSDAIIALTTIEIDEAESAAEDAEAALEE